MDVNELGRLQLDGLREVSNIGAGHAATALSQLTSRRVLVDVPQVLILPIDRAGELTGAPAEPVAAVLMKVFGDVTGRTLQIFPAPVASRLAEILLGREPIAFPDGFGVMERSALQETANIVGGAYLNALSDFLGMMLLPSVPELSVDQAGAVLTTGFLNFDGEVAEHVLCLETRLRMQGEEALRGHFLLLPSGDSLQVILRAIRLD